MKLRRHRLLGISLEILVPILAVLAWGVWSAHAGSLFFPPLTRILTTFHETWLFERFSSDALPSLIRVASGYVLGVGLGILVGFVLGLSPAMRRATGPVVHFLRALPPPAILPFAIVVMGIGDSMKIALIAFGCFFPVLLTTIDGVRSVDSVYIDATRVYGISRWDRLRHVMLPASLPHIAGGMRTSLSLALILVVISEMVAANSGIGFFLLQSQRTYALPEMWAGMILLGLLGYLFNLAFVIFERRALRWHRGARATASLQ
jgi:ABC-type nitrate/sulfonate/bicarbonate transport system permease component